MMLKIAFITPYYNPRDICRGSGTFYCMSLELERQGCQVHYFGPIPYSVPFSTRVWRFLTKRILRKRYITYLDPAVAQVLGKKLMQQLEGVSVDLLMTNDPGVAAGLQVDVPVVYYSDVMIPAVISKASIQKILPYKNVPFAFLMYYQKTMRLCLKNAELVVFPAPWLEEEALKYGVASEKIREIPFGANIPDPGRSVALTRKFEKCAKVRLLFVGVDWVGKGGDVALQTVTLLMEQGLDVTLDVVGLILENAPAYVRCHGLLRKNVPEDWNKLDQLYRTSDVFIFPSHSEGSAIVPREAAAYGLPTLAYRIDGMLSSVVDGQSGVLLEPGSGPEVFAQVITEWLAQPDVYKQLSMGAREFYETNANWDSVVKRLIGELQGLLDFDL